MSELFEKFKEYFTTLTESDDPQRAICENLAKVHIQLADPDEVAGIEKYVSGANYKNLDEADIHEMITTAREQGPLKLALEDVTIAAEGVSAGVAALLTNKRIKALYHGSRGCAPAILANGSVLGKTVEDYDLGFLLELTKNGITEPSELATALHYKPGVIGKPRDKQQTVKTVETALNEQKIVGIQLALAAATRRKGILADLNFKVTAVVVEVSKPPVYILTIKGQKLRLTLQNMVKFDNFSTVYMTTFNRHTPRYRGEEEAEDMGKKTPWKTIVQCWLDMAQEEETPIEANEDAVVDIAVINIIARLRKGKTNSDLHNGAFAVCKKHQRIAFCLDTITNEAENVTALKGVKIRSFPGILRNLGCVNETVYFPLSADDPTIKQIRIWLVPPKWPDIYKDSVVENEAWGGEAGTSSLSDESVGEPVFDI